MAGCPSLISSSSARPVLCCSSKEAMADNSSSKKGMVEWGCDTYSPESAKLLQDWLTVQRLPPQKLTLERVEAGGRGLVAKANIRKGEKLLYVPSSLIITANSEWSNPQSGSVLSAEGVPDWPFLASYLISEASQGTDSPWHSYISALPRQPESILLWSDMEVSKYLSASSVIDQALERIAEVENTYNGIRSSVYSKHPELFPPKFFTAESFKWAFGILFSRLVRLQSLNQQVALVPWADMLNHSSQVDACLDFELTSKRVILTTDRAYQPSEQVFISYGDKSKGEILLSYGFISSDINEIDSMDLYFALNSKDEMLAAKQGALKDHGLSSPCKYPLTIKGLPSQLVSFAYLAACPPSMSSYFSQMAAAAASKEAGMQDSFRSSMFNVPVDVDIQAYELILNTVEASLSKISRFLGENQVVSDGGVSSGKEGKQTTATQSAKLKIACTLCASEQRILYRVQYVLRSKLRELRARKASGGNSPLSGSGLLYGLGKIFK